VRRARRQSNCPNLPYVGKPNPVLNRARHRVYSGMGTPKADPRGLRLGPERGQRRCTVPTPRRQAAYSSQNYLMWRKNLVALRMSSFVPPDDNWQRAPENVPVHVKDRDEVIRGVALIRDAEPSAFSKNSAAFRQRSTLALLLLHSFDRPSFDFGSPTQA